MVCMMMNNDDDQQHFHIEKRNHQEARDEIVPSNDDVVLLNIPDDVEARKTITLPVLEYGYRTTRCSWDEFVDIILHQKILAKISRSEEQQYIYELHKQKVLLQWDTMTDYVLYTKFPNVFTKVESTVVVDSSQPRRWKIDPPVESISTTHLALVKNDFPYYMEDNIEHWILWKLGGDSINDLDFQNAKRDLCMNHNMQENDIIHWVNPIHLKSIPNIEHAHFLGRVK
jgi:hypothetical protein